VLAHTEGWRATARVPCRAGRAAGTAAYWVFEVLAPFGLFCFGFFGVFAFLSMDGSSD
jgi:hypothetical protein